MNEFTPIEFQQYNRHLNLPGFTQDNQLRLKKSSALIIGAGGLGVPVMQYLAAAGVGHISIVDGDTVDVSNLHRQVLYTFSDIGKYKAEVAARFLSDQNRSIHIETELSFLDNSNALNLISQSDIVVDCTDNFPSRYLINDATVLAGKPLVYASVYQYEGQVAFFNEAKEGGRGPNYRDLYPNPPSPGSVPDCATGGVIGVLPGIIGSVQALETIKFLAGLPLSLNGRLYLFDAKTCASRILKLREYSAVKIDRLINYEHFCGVTQSDNNTMNEISVQDLKQWRESGKDFQLVDVREHNERNFVSIDGDHIPLGDIIARSGEIASDKDVVVMCRSGKRSAAAIEALKTQGFERLFNLKGGILAWADEIDPSLPKY